MARSATRQPENTTAIGLGLRALKGGGVLVGVSIERGEPQVVLSTLLATSVDGDRLSFEPYHVAAEMRREPQNKPSTEVEATVTEGHRRQCQLAAENLRSRMQALEKDRYKPVVAALLVNRADWITDLLQYSAAWAEHVPVAEGLAVRDALRFALKECRIEVAELDEKSLPEYSAITLGMRSVAIEARLKSLGATAGRPWRKEQKLACLSAWLAMAARL